MNHEIEDLLYQSGLTAQGCWDELDEYTKESVERLIELAMQKFLEINDATCKTLLGEEINLPGYKATIKLYRDTYQKLVETQFGKHP